MDKLKERALRRRKIRTFSVGAMLFLPPIIMIIWYTWGNQYYKTLPIYGEREVAPNGDTIYHKIPDFTFVDQNGKPFGTKDLEGKIHIADFIFTTCPGICPKLSKNMIKVQEKIKNFKDVQMISISVDPERDSIPALKAYADQYQADGNIWHFLNTKKDSVLFIAQKGYFLPLITEGGNEKGITHSEMVVLIDNKLRIRGYYNGLESKQLDTLVDEIKVLKYAEKHPENITNKKK